MIAKAIIATILGAIVTGGTVYISQNPDVLEPVKPRSTSSQKIDLAVMGPSQIEVETQSPADDLSNPIYPSSKQLTPRSSNGSGEVSLPKLLLPKMPDLTARAPKLTRPKSEKKEAITPQILMDQAVQIRSMDLRDQAYLGVVDYALEHEDFDAAMTAMQALYATQLRDTARANIATKYAKLGKSEAAFGIIDTVEIDDLRDFMRLQVIEAITLPKQPDH